MSLYHDAARLYAQLGAQNRDANLPPITLPHWPIADTALAACLGTLGIPFRHPGPHTDDVDEASGHRQTCFWLGQASEDGTHKIEDILGAWQLRSRFETEFPDHPLNSMRAALDARAFWLSVLHRSLTLPAEANHALCFATTSLREASLLKALDYAPRAFSGRAFFLDPVPTLDLRLSCLGTPHLPAHAALAAAKASEGATPAQWMHRVLVNYDHLVGIAKGQQPIIRMRDGDSTLLLRADATPKTRDTFHALF